MSKIVSSRKPFGLPTNFSNFDTNGELTIYANKKIAKIKQSKLLCNQEWVGKWKLIIPEAIGVADPATDWLKPIIIGPGTCCTETYLVVGPFNTEEEAKSVYSYMQTRFFHFFLSLRKISQHTTQEVYSFIPLLEFNQEWTDDKLFDKYQLNEAERKFIKTTICPNKNL
jgi:site-specific DNA-methyltransferase (adenine-specific)